MSGSGHSTSVTTAKHPSNPISISKARRRADIQGLRAILMVQVLLFHAWAVGSPIGVDAFIMISAYLMTASFVRRAEAGAMPRIADRWATPFKRLLPPLAVVVTLTLLASLLILPGNRWGSIITQSYASLTYWQNWLLQWVSTDYFAENHALSSPLQHLWSMAVQGQVFLLWPVLMTLFVLAAKKRGWPIRRTVLVGFAVLTVASLAWLELSTVPREQIYFDTRARLWEFSLGSAIAAGAPYLRFQRPTERLFAGVGFTVIIIFSLVSIGVYPGVMAAVPLMATSALMMYSNDDPRGVARILSWRPLVAMGNMSYAVYLVHWPIFVFYLVAVGRDQLGIFEGLVLIAISLYLAHLLTKFVDDPIRTSRWAGTVARKTFIVALTLWLSLTVVMTVQDGVWKTAQAAKRAAEEVSVRAAVVDDVRPPRTGGERNFGEGKQAPPPVMEGYPGAAAFLHEGEFSFAGEPVPSPHALDYEWVMYDGQCSAPARALLYQYPKTGCHAHGDAEAGGGRILVAGSSHAEQVLMPAARAYADKHDMYVESSLKAGCPWSMPNPGESPDCGGHNMNVLRYAQENPFDYVFLIVTATRTDSGDEQLGYEVETLIQELVKTGATVIGIRDNLRSGTDLFECANAQDLDAAYGGCLLNRGDFYADDALLDPLMSIPGFHYVDIMDLYCDGDVCPTVAGNVQIYLDTNHVTQTYGNTMAPILVDRIEKVTEKDL